MKRKGWPMREPAKKVASIVSALHALLMNIEKNFDDFDLDDDNEDYEMMALERACIGSLVDDSEEPNSIDLDDDSREGNRRTRLQWAPTTIAFVTRLPTSRSPCISGVPMKKAKLDKLTFTPDDGVISISCADQTSELGESVSADRQLTSVDVGERATADSSTQQFLLLFSLDDFRKQFGVHQRTFEIIVQLVAPYTLKASAKVPGRGQIPAEKQLLISLWLLVNQESFKDVGARFAVCRKTAWQCLHRIVRSLVKINQERCVIQWPSLERAQEIVNGFHALCGFPAVMGVIDSVKIRIKAPSVASDIYADSLGVHSVILQAVCDSKMQFIDCYIGEGGSTDDATVLGRSPLQQIMATATLFPSNCHLIGDPVYPLQSHLLTVYDNDEITPKETGSMRAKVIAHYNECVNKCLNVTQRTFAAVKGRFKRLLRLEMSRVDKIPETIMACCVIHNICVQMEDEPDEADMSSRCDEKQGTAPECDEHDEAIVKRDEIANALYLEQIGTGM